MWASGPVGLPGWLALADRTDPAARAAACVVDCRWSNVYTPAPWLCNDPDDISDVQIERAAISKAYRQVFVHKGFVSSRVQTWRAAPAAQPDSLRLTTRCRLPAEPKPEGSVAMGALAADCSAADCCGDGSTGGAAAECATLCQLAAQFQGAQFLRVPSRALLLSEQCAHHSEPGTHGVLPFHLPQTQAFGDMRRSAELTGGLTGAGRRYGDERQLHVHLAQQRSAQLRDRRDRVRRQQTPGPQHRGRQDAQCILSSELRQACTE